MSMAKNWIRCSTSLVRALIMFVLKKGGGLRLYINYCSLNRITIKNYIPLLLISETIDKL